MKNALMSYNMIFTMINAAYYNVAVLMNLIPLNMMNTCYNIINDLSIYFILITMNYYSVFNPRFSMIPIN